MRDRDERIQMPFFVLVLLPPFFSRGVQTHLLYIYIYCEGKILMMMMMTTMIVVVLTIIIRKRLVNPVSSALKLLLLLFIYLFIGRMDGVRSDSTEPIARCEA